MDRKFVILFSILIAVNNINGSPIWDSDYDFWSILENIFSDYSSSSSEEETVIKCKNCTVTVNCNNKTDSGQNGSKPSVTTPVNSAADQSSTTQSSTSSSSSSNAPTNGQATSAAPSNGPATSGASSNGPSTTSAAPSNGQASSETPTSSPESSQPTEATNVIE